MDMVTTLLLALLAAGTPFERLQAKIPGLRPVTSTQIDWSGHYATGTGLAGQTSGTDLHLFPDGTYIYSEWADSAPRRIFDKGRWMMAAGIVELKSDPEVRWPPSVERRLVAVQRRRQPDEVILVGEERKLAIFEAAAMGDAQRALMVVGLARRKGLGRDRGAKLKETLMSEAWKPESFARESTR
jgi:hypothetical protein